MNPEQSAWINRPQIGFTAFYAKYLRVSVPVDLVDDAQVRVMVQRSDLLATVTAVKQGKQTAAIRRANVVSN